MYGPESPHKDAKTIDWEGTDVYKKQHKTNLDDFKEIVDDSQLLKEEIEKDKNQLESLSKQDEILFNILKWIFNAIRKEKEYVNKNDLIGQLEINKQIVDSFGFGSFENFKDQLARFSTQQEGTWTWDEFIDFFISHSWIANDKNEWWKSFLLDMDAKEKARKEQEIYNSPEQKQKRLNEEVFQKSAKKLSFDLKEIDQEKMKMLSDSRVSKTQFDLKNTKFDTGYDTTADELDIFK